LFVHGRKAYVNNSEIVLFFLYKNLVMTLPHYFFAFNTGFSGTSFYEDWSLTFYNLIFTNFPCGWRAIFDFDVSPELDGNAVKPYIQELYYVGQMSLVFNKLNYLKWFALAVLHAAIVYYLPQFTFQTSISSGFDGHEADFSIMSMASFSAVIYIVNIKVALLSRTINIINCISIVGSMLIYYCWIWVGNYLVRSF
jgi:phospholipid-transporting ATPase